MCDIRKETKLKMKTVYKVVFKEKGKYYGLFSGMLVKKGNVSTRKRKVHNSNFVISDYKQSQFYNELMIGRVSGFQHKSVAKDLFKSDENEVGGICVLKITLSGSIYKGTGAHISCAVPDSEPTFAGTTVLDYKEVWTAKQD